MQSTSFPLRSTLGVWVVLATAAALILPPPQAPTPLRLMFILGPVLAFGVALKTSTRLYATLDALNARWIVALHGVRAVIGAAFLILGQSGQLPPEFANGAGIGDVSAGSAALLLVLAWLWVSRNGRALIVLWNVLGILDFLNVQRIVAISLRGRESEFIAMNHLPLALVPYFGVPLLFASHVFLVSKYARPRAVTAR